MRLTDIVNQIQRRVSEGTNIIRHPFQAVYRAGRKRFQGWYEGAKIPGGDDKSAQQHEAQKPEPDAASSTIETSFQSPSTAATLSLDGRSFSNNRNGRSQTALLPQITQPSTLDTSAIPTLFSTELPPLQLGEVLQGGWWGRYTLGRCIQQFPWMRLYEGLAMNGDEPIWVYEYLLLEESFSQQEAEQRQEHFRKLINQNLRLGNGSDFRIVKLKDVMVDPKSQRRCYLITNSITEGMTLATYLESQGTMSARQIRQVLQQVLQSLQYLHTTYRVRWLDDRSDRGLVHGNLTLDSLWIRWGQSRRALQGKPFFIYLSRFALWEHVCWSPTGGYRLSQTAKDSYGLGKVADDLADLGSIAFALLTGKIPDGQGQSAPIPEDIEPWPQTPEAIALRPFILRLLGLGPEQAFKSADTALAALRVLPEEFISEPEAALEVSDAVVAEEGTRVAWLAVGLPLLLLILAIGSLLTYFLLRRSKTPLFVERCEAPCTIGAVAESSSIRSVNYAILQNTSWMSSFNRFVGDSLADLESLQGSALERLLEKRSSWELNRLPLENETTILEALSQRRLQFALLQNLTLESQDLSQSVVAKDGIVFFVVFSDENRLNNIPKLLNGKISLRDLGRLYSNQEVNLSGKAVQLYFPKGESTVALLKEQLLAQDLLTQETEAEFNRLWQQDVLASQSHQKGAERDDLYARMLRDFEADAGNSSEPRVIGIGFDLISNVFGQCSVYPLAVETHSTTYSVLVEFSGKPVSPATDLCGDKGGYWINSDAFQDNSYPFQYGLSVVYPSCDTSQTACEAGQAFAQMMQTSEGQYLLSEVGLVPLEPLDKLHRILWSGNND